MPLLSPLPALILSPPLVLRADRPTPFHFECTSALSLNAKCDAGGAAKNHIGPPSSLTSMSLRVEDKSFFPATRSSSPKSPPTPLFLFPVNRPQDGNAGQRAKASVSCFFPWTVSRTLQNPSFGKIVFIFDLEFVTGFVCPSGHWLSSRAFTPPVCGFAPGCTPSRPVPSVV
jgi:hypothetical protein